MSLETWKAEFYPVDARDVAAEDAIEHSLRKWRGLRAEALRKHGVHFSRDCNGLTGDAVGGFLPITADSCALCHRFYDEEAYQPCATCPLAIARSRYACDEDSLGGTAPWNTWVDKKDPEPMITALEDAAQHAGAAS